MSVLKRIGGIVAAILILVLLSSGILNNIGEFVLWLFTLKNSQPNISKAGAIIVRFLTFATSYGLVGLIFEWLGWFNGKAMKGVYAVISTIIGFIFAYIVWQIEEHIALILIITSIVSFLSLAIWIVCSVLSKKKNDDENEDQDQ